MEVRKELRGSVLFVELSGALTDSASLGTSFDEGFSELRLNTRNLVRINSVGIRTWVSFFQKLKTRGIRVTLEECSPVVVDQINNIQNFADWMNIESVLVPFLCPHCETESVALYTTEKLRALKFKIPAETCEKCQKSTIFDDDSDDYFGFLTRSSF